MPKVEGDQADLIVPKIEISKKKITFDDYEAFLDKLDKDGRLESISQNNPKERKAFIENTWDNREHEM